jgi:alpha-galactosidase
MLGSAYSQLEISTKDNTLLISAEKGQVAKLLYYGDKLNDVSHHKSLGNSLGIETDLYPTFGLNCDSEYALQVTHADGNMSLELAVESVTQKLVDGVQLTTIVTKDKVYPFWVTIFYKSFVNSNVIETWTEIKHQEKNNVTLFKAFSAALQLPTGRHWLSQLNGTWARENCLSESLLTLGPKLIANKEGIRNTQNDNPSFMVSMDGAVTETTGNVMGGALAWTGNYKLLFNLNSNDRLDIIAGTNEEASQYYLAKNEVYKTPSFLMSYSAKGKGQLSRNFHHWALNDGGLYGANKPNDVLLNSWEGVYFKVNQEVMNVMMKDFSDLGGELFVMDDGWFGDKYPRDNGVTSLGDWVVAKGKLPQGIEGLVETAKKNNIKFGIWIEPEMLNSKSELFEKHPEWVIQQPNRETIKGRGGTQMTLDLSNPKVQEFVFKVVDDLMTKNPQIAYIKWDANHNITNYGSTYLPKDKQSHLYIQYHRGLQSVLDRVRVKYPDLVMQACGSGGGRVTYGYLKYFDEFWTSDDTDAVERLYMQWGVSHFYPAQAMASHVSAKKNHQTGRDIPLKFRFDVAMTGRLGMEMKPSDLDEKEKAFAAKGIKCYKEMRDIVQFGDLYRLLSPYENAGRASLMYVTPTKDQAVFFAYNPHLKKGYDLAPFKMDGLNPDAMYRVIELNYEGDKPRIGGDNFTLSGRELMTSGLNLKVINGEYRSIILKLQVVG